MKAPKSYTFAPVAVEAIQWTGLNRTEITSFVDYKDPFDNKHGNLITVPLDGKMVAIYPGEWVVRYKREFGIDKTDVFTNEYFKRFFLALE